jgi:hypothetical protein
VGQTLRSILAGGLLYTVVAMGLALSCLPRGTCCRRYLAFVSTAAMVFLGAEVDAFVFVATEALALRALALAGEGPLLLALGLPELLFPTQFAVA